MPRRYPTFFPQRVNLRVPNMAYSSSIEGDDLVTAEFGAPLALSNNGILAAQPVAAAGGTSAFAAAFVQSEAQMGRWGRALRAVLSGAGTGTLVVTGRDYLGQRMIENFALNGATPVLGLKAFRYIDRIDWPTVGAVNLDVGWRDCFGLPLKLRGVVSEVKNGNITANAGTFANALANTVTATATNADVRGTYVPVTVIPDGTNTFEVRYVADTSNLHGNAQFRG